MALNDSIKVDLLYKKLFGSTRTYGGKAPSGEAIASPSLIRGDNAWLNAGSIPGTAAALTGVVQAYTSTSLVESTADTTTTATSNGTQNIYTAFKTGLTDWVPPEFDLTGVPNTYKVSVYYAAAASAASFPTGFTQLSADGDGTRGEWYFDYQSGVLHFLNVPATGMTTSSSIYVVGYRYIGPKGTDKVTASGYTTTVTAAGTTTLTAASTYQQFFTGTTTQTVQLPVTSTLTLGRTFLIVNNSTGAVTVNSSGANQVVVIAAGSSSAITCILQSGTTAASWSYSQTGTANTATNLAGGALGSLPYQNSTGATLFVSGNTTTTPQFLTSTGTGSAAQAPTLTSSTGSGNVVLATSPSIAGGAYTGITNLAIRDTSATFDVTIGATSSTTLTGGRALTLDVVNAARTVKLGGNLSFGANFTTDANGTISFVTSGTTSLTLPTSGTVTALGNTTTGSGTNIVLGTSPTITTSIVAGSASMDIFNTTATTVNFAGAGTAISIGSTTGTLTINNATTVIAGNLTVNGTTTSVNSNTVSVDDKNLELGGVVAVSPTGNISAGSAVVTNLSSTANIIPGSAVSSLSGNGTVTLPASTTVASIDSATQITLSAALTGTSTATGATLNIGGPTDVTAAGGGITLKGASDHSITWSSANGWTSTEDINVATGKIYRINGTSVLSATTLGSGVTGSSLTSVGTFGTGVWQGTIVGSTYGGTGVNNGSSTITLGGNLTTSGAFATTLTVTATTNATLPAGTKTLLATDGSGSSLTFGTGSLALASNLSTTGAFTTSLTQSANVTLALPGSNGTLATLGNTETFSGSKTFSSAITLATSTPTNIATEYVVQATVATVALTAVDTWAIATYRSVKYFVQITQSTNYQVSEVLVIHNGTTTTMTEYGALETNGALATFTSDISGGNARLLVTMGSATSATINIVRTLIVV